MLHNIKAPWLNAQTVCTQNAKWDLKSHLECIQYQVANDVSVSELWQIARRPLDPWNPMKKTKTPQNGGKSPPKVEKKQKGGLVKGWFWRTCPRSAGEHANVPSFRFSFWGNIRMYTRCGCRSGGNSRKTTLLRTPENWQKVTTMSFRVSSEFPRVPPNFSSRRDFMQFSTELCELPVRKWAPLQFRGAANGGSRDGGLTKAEDIWGKRRFHASSGFPSCASGPPGAKGRQKGEKLSADFQEGRPDTP